MDTTSWTETLWASTADDVFPAILAHPFLQGLTDGSLPVAAFRHYVAQDALYLDRFGRGLAILAAKCEPASDFMMFCEHARNTLIVEQALHSGFIAEWGGARATEMAPTCALYTGHLLQIAWERPVWEGLAAFLPCYWIYAEVGKKLLPQGSPDPLYQRWIDTYGGEEFQQVVAEAKAAVDRVGVGLTHTQRAAGEACFRRSAQCEWMFWDMGWRQETWPVG